MRISTERVLARWRGEDGVVLVTVMLISMVLLTLVAGSMAYSLGSQNLSRREQDWNAALAASEAGLDDFLFRLNEDETYWTYSATNPPPDGNQAFDTWVPIPGPTIEGSFRYDVDTSTIATDGIVKVEATGRVRGVTRTVQAFLRHKGFLDFLYFTDSEARDPAIYDTTTGDDYTPAQAQIFCSQRYYQGRDIDNRVDFVGDTDGNICTEIQFVTGDSIQGPMHSNDAIHITGNPQFLGDTSTSWPDPTGQRWWGSGSPSFRPGDPRYADPLTMPPNNLEIKNETDPLLGGEGCLFTGPTAINVRNDGTMDVISPFTRNKRCAVTGTPITSMFNRFTITRMPLPPNGVIYVQNVPSVVTDANYTAGCPFSRPRVGGGSNIAHPLGFPQTNDVTPTSWYNCRNGDVFLMGTLSGRLTIAADNNIVLFGSTTYNTGTTGTDLLGLVANNYVEVYHPTKTSSGGTCDGSVVNGACNMKLPGLTTTSTTPSLFSGSTPGTSTMATVTSARSLRDPTFHAAMLTVQHSFRVQNNRHGDENVSGTLHVVGAIAQRYRGPVGNAAGTGYAKDYIYDQRLSYQSPPHFLEPVQTAWQITSWIEQKAAYPASAP
jgi:hypothetical protein